MSVFECGICAEEYRITRNNCIRMTDAKEDRICRECFEGSVIDGFRQATNNPTEYPYRWGGQAIYFQNFRDHIPDAAWTELQAAYNARRLELETPITERLRCRLCGAFAGKRSAGGNVQCPSCSQQICAECGQRAGPHNCDDEPDEHLKGLQRGKEYQRCPGCRNPTELKDGCNHMICPTCLTNYCYICGREAHPDSGHWSAGNPCPRYNQPGTENAQYDHPRAAEYARWEDEYVPDEYDFSLQEHVRRTRRLLSAIRATIVQEALTDGPRTELLQRLILTIDNLIVEIGVLDFEERFDADLHDEDDTERYAQIERAWRDPQLRELISGLPAMDMAMRDLLAMEVDHDHRAYIVQDVRAAL